MKRKNIVDSRAQSRRYANKHRDEWGVLGIIPATIKVPIERKDEILCVAEKMRADHMVGLVESPRTSMKTFEQLATRNSPRRLNKVAVDGYVTLCKGTSVGNLAKDAHELFDYATKKHDMNAVYWKKEDNPELATILQAKMTAYAYLMHAMAKEIKRLRDIAVSEITADVDAAAAVEKAVEESAARGEDLAKLKALGGEYE